MERFPRPERRAPRSPFLVPLKPKPSVAVLPQARPAFRGTPEAGTRFRRPTRRRVSCWFALNLDATFRGTRPGKQQPAADTEHRDSGHRGKRRMRSAAPDLVVPQAERRRIETSRWIWESSPVRRFAGGCSQRAGILPGRSASWRFSTWTGLVCHTPCVWVALMTSAMVSDCELESWPTERLEAELVSWAGRLAAAEYQFLRLLARFDSLQGWQRWECMSCAHWLNWHCALDLRAAQEKLRVSARP